VFNAVRAAEEADAEGVTWPRAKRCDDVGVVHFATQRLDLARPEPAGVRRSSV